MRYARGIVVEQLIVHILNPWRKNGLVLSERALPLGASPELQEYFGAHIENSLQDPVAKAARFVDPKAETCQACQQLLDGSLDLVAGSRSLAQKLYGIMASDRRISAGDLAVAFYRAANRPAVERYLALLKIDPSEVFRHKTERDSQGRIYVNFEVERDVMPTAREKLQKCAFVQPLQPRPGGYDMILLDRQVAPTAPLPVAKFFAQTFLGAGWALDARERTDILYTSLISAMNQLREQLKPDELDKLRQAIDAAVAAARIQLDQWISALPLSDKHKEHIDRVVSEALPDRDFAIDATYAQKLVRKRRFRGDHGLRVEVPADHYDDVVQSVQRVRDADGPAYYRVVIHTEQWKEVRR
jgi:hypothetical protein